MLPLPGEPDNEGVTQPCLSSRCGTLRQSPGRVLIWRKSPSGPLKLSGFFDCLLFSVHEPCSASCTRRGLDDRTCI